MQCKSLWIKASAKCINVNVNVNFTNTPHFKAYKCLVEGARASVSVSSTRDCKALISSDDPEVATHGGSIIPGWGATPSRPPGIAYPS